MEEILESQDSMLARLGKPTHPGADIAKAYRQQVRHAKTWLTGRGIPAMSVSYADLVHRPDEALPPLAAFLGVPEKLAAMRAVIDPTLHRARSGAELGSVRSGDLTVASSSPAAQRGDNKVPAP